MQLWTMWHRPVLRAGVNGSDAHPLGDWTASWPEARNVLLGMGMAFYIHGILVLTPVVTIEKEVVYG